MEWLRTLEDCYDFIEGASDNSDADDFGWRE